MPQPLYLDNAATSWPKPRAVTNAITSALTTPLGNPARGAHRPALDAARHLDTTRSRLARLINAESPNRIVLTAGCTDALNLAIHATLDARRRAEPKAPLHAVATALDHNAVLRPLAWEADRHNVKVTHTPITHAGLIDPDALETALTEHTALVCLPHASNVTGVIQPIADLAARIRSRAPDALILVDGAQTAGVLPIDVRALNTDFYAFGAHKALRSIAGIGALYVSQRAHHATASNHDPPMFHVEPHRQGGTGHDSASLLIKPDLPSAFEPGTPNLLAAIALTAAIDHLDPTALDNERAALAPLYDWLATRADVRAPHAGTPRVGVLSLDTTDAAMNPHDIAAILDADFDIATRAGLHCAPLAHAALNTAEQGMLRISTSPDTTPGDIARLTAALDQILA